MSRRHRRRQRALTAAADFRKSIEWRGSTSGDAARTISWRRDVVSGITVRLEAGDSAVGRRRHGRYGRMTRWRARCQLTGRPVRGRRCYLNALWKCPLRVGLNRQRATTDDPWHSGYVIFTQTNTYRNNRFTSLLINALIHIATTLSVTWLRNW